ncbi:hypothetical protein [Luteibaculum oceani]|uniref:Lipoprotein n=1 Tax=Luteibaculum oceani TaxID=1294296 RepID=A0A5C6UQK7_9FLAO|nr:hypothetical protein [Luteibaculum oceani]TXC75623.1 hypothetical protein FRX97_11635 [Luteibaculum oceani]
MMRVFFWKAFLLISFQLLGLSCSNEENNIEDFKAQLFLNTRDCINCTPKVLYNFCRLYKKENKGEKNLKSLVVVVPKTGSTKYSRMSFKDRLYRDYTCLEGIKISKIIYSDQIFKDKTASFKGGKSDSYLILKDESGNPTVRNLK